MSDLTQIDDLTTDSESPALRRGMDWLMERARKAEAEIARVRCEDCPRCEGPDSAVAVDCRQRFQVLDHDDKPLCRWAAEGALRKQRSEQIQVRADRLQRAGAIDPALVRLLCETEGAPRPDARWYREADDLASHDRARLAIERFVADATPQALVLMGRTGTGKSVLAAWAFARTRDAVWVPASKANGYETWNEVAPQVGRSPVIFIDDLGRERDGQTHYATETLSEAINAALDSGRRVVITTNLTPRASTDREASISERQPGIYERYGQRLYSRLFQRGVWLGLGNNDLRVSSKGRAA